MTQTHTQCKQVEPQSSSPHMRRGLWILLILAPIAAVLLQLVVAPPPGYFDYDEAIWFYPLYGLLACIALALVSRLLGIFLKRRETYWEDKR